VIYLGIAIGYVGALATPAAAVLIAIATERTGYRCTACRWTTGMRAAASAWLRWRWHRHVTRPLGRCRSVAR
jgi:hypothetical protein